MKASNPLTQLYLLKFLDDTFNIETLFIKKNLPTELVQENILQNRLFFCLDILMKRSIEGSCNRKVTSNKKHKERIKLAQAGNIGFCTSVA